MKRLVILMLILGAAIISVAAPVFAGTSILTGTLTNANLLPNGRPDDGNNACVDKLDTDGPYYYELRQIQVTASGAYDYRDVGYLDDSDTYGTIDIWVSFYTGAPGGFDSSNPLSNGCFANLDDNGTVNLTAGVTYTLMTSSYDNDPNTGNFLFSLTGPGDVIEVSADCPNPLPTTAVVHSIPAGAPAFYAADLGAATGFNIPAGTWWTFGTSGDFTHVWIACQASPVWVPTNAVAQ